LRAAKVRPDFHARRSATSKEYRYFVWNDPVMPPDRRLYAAHVYRPLDVTAMSTLRNFSLASTTSPPSPRIRIAKVETTVRRITFFTVRRSGRAICFRVRGNGFLYRQVRSMVGFLLRVGEGAEKPEAVRELLHQRAPRTARVPTAPPQGLFLWQVWHAKEPAGCRRGVNMTSENETVAGQHRRDAG